MAPTRLTLAGVISPRDCGSFPRGHSRVGNALFELPSEHRLDFAIRLHRLFDGLHQVRLVTPGGRGIGKWFPAVGMIGSCGPLVALLSVSMHCSTVTRPLTVCSLALTTTARPIRAGGKDIQLTMVAISEAGKALLG
jgi:hypothetical protein